MKRPKRKRSRSSRPASGARLEKLYAREETLQKEIADWIEWHDLEDGDEVQGLAKILAKLGKNLTRVQKGIFG